ncbi:thioredoxin [Natronomonas sp. EA1]|uniref:thioredoxin n=1 Tax=Natronomonas sp. EA1 TaxID=3421655 RepID=UPI003EBFDE85
MSDSDDELERIQEAKREQLRAAGERSDPIRIETRAQFEELVRSRDVVLVDFYADWCGPCKLLEPTVETLARESPATVLKVDVDEHQAIASEYQVQGVPTLYLFVDGEPRERMVGVQDEATLSNTIAQYA